MVTEDAPCNTYLCSDINETGPSLVIFLIIRQFYVVRFFSSFFVGYVCKQAFVNRVGHFCLLRNKFQTTYESLHVRY